MTSDCDPFNLYCPVALERIKVFAKHPKFVISLRDPVARAYSDWNMHRLEDETRSFEQVVNDELSGKEQRFRKRFLNQSIYEPHVRRWFENFDRSQILIIQAETLFAEPKQTANQLFDFLELPSHATDLSRKNASPYQKELNAETTERLRAYFEPYNQRLYELVGQDFGWG